MKLDDVELEDTQVKTKDDRKKAAPDKDKIFIIEAVAGIVLLIVLIVIAIMLLFGDKSGDDTKDTQIVEEMAESEDGGMLETDSLTEPSEDVGPGEAAADVNTDTGALKTMEAKKQTDLTELNKTVPVKGELPQVYTPGKMLTYTKDSYQLPELYSYWDNYQLDAVADLIRLERVRAISNSLGKSNDYYYYGSTNSDGQPDGRGLAVYALNTYYFGEWSDGKREGDGMWIRIFPDKTGILNGVSGVKEHQYNGSWYDDLPCGKGQEHIDYDVSMIEGEYVITNAIGEFADGYYQGDMYIMTINKNGNTLDWYGACEKGSFVFLNDKKTKLGKRSIWKIGDGYSTDEEDGCRWILPKDNVNFGVAGLKR